MRIITCTPLAAGCRSCRPLSTDCNSRSSSCCTLSVKPRPVCTTNHNYKSPSVISTCSTSSTAAASDLPVFPKTYWRIMYVLCDITLLLAALLEREATNSELLPTAIKKEPAKRFFFCVSERLKLTSKELLKKAILGDLRSLSIHHGAVSSRSFSVVSVVAFRKHFSCVNIWASPSI